MLTFDVGERQFALRAESVAEIVFMASLSCQPGTPSVLAGFLNREGAAVPVINLARLIGVRDVRIELHTPIILVRHEKQQFGLLVDRVQRVTTTALSAPIPISIAAMNVSATRLDDKIVPILSIPELILKQEHDRIEELRASQQKRLVELREAAAACP